MYCSNNKKYKYFTIILSVCLLNIVINNVSLSNEDIISKQEFQKLLDIKHNITGLKKISETMFELMFNTNDDDKEEVTKSTVTVTANDNKKVKPTTVPNDVSMTENKGLDDRTTERIIGDGGEREETRKMDKVTCDQNFMGMSNLICKTFQQMSSAHSTVDILQKQITELNEHIIKLNEQASKLQQAVNANGDAETLRAQLVTTQAQLITAKNEEIERLKQEKAQQQQKLEGLTKDLKIKDNALNRARQKLNVQTHEQLCSISEKLNKEQNTQQTKQLKELEEALELKQKQLNKANANTSEANNNTKLANEKLEQVKQFATQLADVNTELKNENERQRAEIEKQSEDIEKCRHINEALAEQFITTGNQIIITKDAEVEKEKQLRKQQREEVLKANQSIEFMDKKLRAYIDLMTKIEKKCKACKDNALAKSIQDTFKEFRDENNSKTIDLSNKQVIYWYY